MACYYLVISSTHLSNGHFRRVKGVFRGPLCHGSDSPEQPERPDGCSLEDLKALYYCELCDKQYLRHQEFDNHINSYDHAHKQRLKELKQREFARNVASKSWKDQRKQEKALRRLHQQAQLQQETHRVSGRNCGVRSAVRVVNKSRETERRDFSPEDKPFKLRDTPSASHTLGCCQKDSCGSLNQLSSTLSVSRVGDSLQDSYAQRGKVGGRLGVSFCFSRKGPRLEPSASVFSDHEEEEREKREQIRERIKKIIKDIDREIEESNQERKYTEIIQDDATMSVDKTEDAGTQREIADSPSGEKEEQEDAGKAEEHRCVLGKDGATELSWPVSLLRFTKSEPHISYSCNPKQLQHGPERQEGKLSPSTDEQSPCLSNTFREENGPERTEGETKVAGAVDTKSEAHLFLENKRLSSPDGEGRMPSIDARAVAHSFVPSDSSDTNSWCPQEERLRGARGIREGASAVVSSKLEPVTRASPQSVCIRLSRCDCGRQVAGKSGPKILKADTTVTAPFEKRIRINKLGKKKRGKRGNASNKKQKCKLKSVVMTVPNVTDKKMFVNRRESKTGGKRRRNEGNGFLSGRCAAKPLSIRRNFTLGSASEHCSTYSPQTRLPADRDPDIQRRWERNVVTSQWQTHNSIHAFAPAHCKKLFWEKGHHGNPRSFIDCSYPDNSCNSSPARKRKIHHRENIHSKRSSLRHCEEERGQTGSGDRCLVSATEHSEWLRGNSLSGTVAEDGLFKADLAPRSRAAKYNWVSSPCPSRRYRSGRTPEEMEWDGCSLDRWTWGSTDSWDDRDTQRRKTGPQGESDRSENSSFTRKGSDNRRSRHSPSPEWWMRHSEGGLDLSPAEDNACHSPCSYSPMSSTSMSEMSWEWSRSSTCSSFTLNKKPSNPNRGNPDTPEHLPEEDRKQSKPAPASLSCKSIKDVPHNVLEPTVKQDSSPPQVTTASPATPVLALPEPVQRKITKTLLFPLIGKRPAIQKKERKRRKIQEKSEEKASGDKSLAIVGGQKSLQANEAKFSPEELKAADKQTMDEAAQPISFSVEEIDKYRQLQEEARKHMQKVLERTQESAHEDSTHSTTSERYRTPHMDTLQVGLLHRGGVANVGQRDNKTVIPVSLSPALSNLHHIILHSAHTVPSSAATSPPPGAHPHPPQLSLSPTHPSLTHYLHLSPLSISSLLPSVFLSQHPIHLLRPCPAFTPLDPFSALQMQPLNPQPFMDRTWPVRFQQKAL